MRSDGMAASDGPELLAQIAEETQVCTRCDLCIGAHRAAPGSGDARAEVMLIGEAPSSYDDRSGVPFSGPSGAFLDELLGLAGLQRSRVFLTNVVKHRVPEGHSLQSSEIAACAGYLTRQIAALRPKVIVTLGRYSLARFLTRAKITTIHGQARLHEGRILVAMYNPAAALRREELRQTVVDDFARALPAALAEARRLAAEGKLGGVTPPDEGQAPQQMSLF
jgi:uracil-DNA glycosylase family 4